MDVSASSRGGLDVLGHWTRTGSRDALNYIRRYGSSYVDGDEDDMLSDRYVDFEEGYCKHSTKNRVVLAI